jgi:peptidylprolyl isomerase
MSKKLILLLAVFSTFLSCRDKHSNLPDGLYAEITTNKGTIIVELEYAKTPVTVANFVTLAEGKNTFVNEKFKGKPFYNGLKFHRVIPNFMIQGGDPLGNGSGDAGYKFKDEFTDLLHDKPGTLSMANSGPNTNSSQFFITHVATPWLDGMYTVFGHVVENGMETVNKIVQDDTIMSITIIRKGEAAKKFDAAKVFHNYFTTELENQKKQAIIEAENKKLYAEKYKAVIEEKRVSLNNVKNTAKKSNTGLAYSIIKKGSGVKPANGKPVLINYAGYFEDGTLFDTNIREVAKKFGKDDPMRATQNGYTPMRFITGRKEGMIPGFIEGIEKLSFGDKAVIFIPSNLAFGEAGAGSVIPPNASLIFEIELLSESK